MSRTDVDGGVAAQHPTTPRDSYPIHRGNRGESQGCFSGDWRFPGTHNLRSARGRRANGTTSALMWAACYGTLWFMAGAPDLMCPRMCPLRPGSPVTGRQAVEVALLRRRLGVDVRSTPVSLAQVLPDLDLIHRGGYRVVLSTDPRNGLAAPWCGFDR